MSATRVWVPTEPVVLAARWLLGGLFALAAVSKIGAPAQLAEDIANFRLVPGGFENTLAIVLPWIELVVAVALFTTRRGRAGAWLGGALMVVFTLAVASAMARGLNIACGCFGTLDAPRVGAMKLTENLAILLLCGIAAHRRDARGPF